LRYQGGKNEGFALLVVVPAVCRHAGGNVFHPPYFVSNKPHELIAIALTVLAASRFSMLVTVLIGVGSSGL